MGVILTPPSEVASSTQSVSRSGVNIPTCVNVRLLSDLVAQSMASVMSDPLPAWNSRSPACSSGGQGRHEAHTIAILIYIMNRLMVVVLNPGQRY